MESTGLQQRACSSPIILAIDSVALTLTLIFTFDCRFYGYKGLWTYLRWGECHLYEGFFPFGFFRPSMMLARATSLAATLLSFPTLVAAGLLIRTSFSRRRMLFLSVAEFVISVLCLLSLTALTNGSIGGSGVACVLAFLLWATAGVLTIRIKDDPHFDQQQDLGQTLGGSSYPPNESDTEANDGNDKGKKMEISGVTYSGPPAPSSYPTKTAVFVEVTRNSDGTGKKVTTKTKTRPDGVQTVTKTIEQLDP